MPINRIVMSQTWFQVPAPNKLLLFFFSHDTRDAFYKEYREELNRQLKKRDADIVLNEWEKVGYDRRIAKILLGHFAREFGLESTSVMPDDPLYLFSFPDRQGKYCSLQECCQSFGTMLYDFIRYFAGGCDDKFIPEARIDSNKFEKLYDFYISKSEEITVSTLLRFLWRFRNKKRSYFYLDWFDL